MATIAAQSTSSSGLELTTEAAAAGGDQFLNTSGDPVFYVLNGSGGDITATFATQITVDGLAVADQAVVVSAGEARYCGPFKSGTYNDTDGYVQVTYSGVTTVTVAVINVP